MLIIIYIFILVFLLILLVLFTAIGFTFKFNVLSLEERKEFGGTFIIKWLLFSHTFSFEEPKAKESLFKEPKKPKPKKEVIIEQGDWRDEKGFEQSEYRGKDLSKKESKISAEKRRKIREKTPEEKVTIAQSEEKTEIKEREEPKERAKTEKGREIKGKDEKKENESPIDKTRGNKGVKKEDQVEPETGMNTREKLYWGLKAFRCLRKPALRLFSDILQGIKIKRLDSRIIFGLSDPADTGMLCGLIHTFAGFIYSRCKHCSFSINPVFMMSPMLDFRGDVEIRMKIYSMILPFIKFIFNRNTLSFTHSVVKELFQRKWKSEWEPKWKSKSVS